MVTQQQVLGNWRQIVGHVKSRWGELTDDELIQTEGDVEQLVGLIQQKTGESREEVEAYLDHIVDGRDIKETARHYMDEASDRLREQSEALSESFQAGYAEAEQMMQRHPLETVAVAFGAGLVGGVIVGLMIRR